MTTGRINQVTTKRARREPCGPWRPSSSPAEAGRSGLGWVGGPTEHRALPVNRGPRCLEPPHSILLGTAHGAERTTGLLGRRWALPWAAPQCQPASRLEPLRGEIDLPSWRRVKDTAAHRVFIQGPHPASTAALRRQPRPRAVANSLHRTEHEHTAPFFAGSKARRQRIELCCRSPATKQTAGIGADTFLRKKGMTTTTLFQPVGIQR